MNKIKLNDLITFFITSFLVIIATFREPGITPDTSSYFLISKDFFNAYLISVEPFHYLLLSILNYFEINYYTSTQVIFFVYASLSIVALNTAYNAFNLQNKLPLYLYLFTSFLYLNLIQIRWGLAVAIIILGISQLKNSRFRSLIFLSIAPLVHTFAIITLPFFFMFRFRTNRLLFFILPFLGIFLGKYFDYQIIINVISKINFDFIENYKNNIILKIRYYFDVDRIIYKDNPINLMSIFFIGSYYLSLLKSQIVDNSVYYLYIQALGIGIFTYFFLSDISIFSRRIMFLLVPMAIPLFVYCSYFYKYGQFMRVLGLIFCILICVNFAFVKGLVRL